MTRRVYRTRDGGRLIVRADRTCWVQPPWGGPFHPLPRAEAARALRTARRIGVLLHA